MLYNKKLYHEVFCHLVYYFLSFKIIVFLNFINIFLNYNILIIFPSTPALALPTSLSTPKCLVLVFYLHVHCRGVGAWGPERVLSPPELDGCYEPWDVGVGN